MNASNLLKSWLTVDLSVDMGSSRTRIYQRGAGLALNEPSYITVSYREREALAAGKESYRMWGRCPMNIEVVKPLARGMIENFDLAEEMLRRFLDVVFRRKALLGARMVMVVPAGATDVEKKAFEDIAMQVGGREVFLVEAPIAAAIGMGLRIQREPALALVYLGAATTQGVVFSSGELIYSHYEAVGGDTLTEAIIAGIRKKYRLIVGMHTAEELKTTMSGAFPTDKIEEREIYGKGVEDGLPRSVVVSNHDLREMLRAPLEQILNSIKTVLDKVPPELSRDINQSGIHITGGNSMTRGLTKLVTHETGLKCVTPKDGLTSCIAGADAILANLKSYKDLTTSSHSRRFTD